MKVNPDDLIRQTTAAKMRGVSTQAIINLVRRGKLTAVMIDGQNYVFRSEVENFKPSAGGRPKGARGKRKSGRSAQN